MRKWGDLTDEVLGLMFTNNTGGEKIGINDASCKEYTINIHHAYNFAADDLAKTVKCFYKYADIDPEKEKKIDFRLLDPMFYGFDTDNIYAEKEGILKKTYDYRIYGAVFAPESNNRYKVKYYYLPEKMSYGQDPDTDIDIPSDILSAAALYMAYRLYLEDDPSVAATYLNQYMARKEELYLRYNENEVSQGAEFVNRREWY